MAPSVCVWQAIQSFLIALHLFYSLTAKTSHAQCFSDRFIPTNVTNGYCWCPNYHVFVAANRAQPLTTSAVLCVETILTHTTARSLVVGRITSWSLFSLAPGSVANNIKKTINKGGISSNAFSPLNSACSKRDIRFTPSQILQKPYLLSCYTCPRSSGYVL